MHKIPFHSFKTIQGLELDYFNLKPLVNFLTHVFCFELSVFKKEESENLKQIAKKASLKANIK